MGVALINGHLVSDSGVNLSTKADLVNGLVPSSQLPSYVDDVLEYANLAAFPATGETGKIYVAQDSNKIYRWSGSTYIEVSPSVGTTWGGISGTLSNQTDLQNALNAKQAQLNGTGFVKASGTTITYDNSTYLTSAANWFGAVETGGTLDWNHVTNTRPGSGYTLLLGNATNGFGNGTYYHPFNLEYSTKDGTGQVTQLAIAYGTPANDIKMRGRYLGTWTSWITFWNTANLSVSGTANYVAKFTASTSLGNSQLFDNGTNVGIGTVSPATKLEVGGVIRGTRINSTGGVVDFDSQSGSNFIQVATSIMSFANGGAVNMSIAANGGVTMTSLAGTGTRMVVADANGLLSAQTISGGTVTGTGTTNYIPKFTGTSALGNSQIFDNGSSVGIGTTNPTGRFSIAATSATNDVDYTLLRYDVGTDATLGPLYFMTTMRPSATGTNRRVEMYAGDGLAYRNIVFTYGNIGIGTTAPQTRFHVGGSTTSELSIGTITYGGNSNQALASIQSDQSSGTSGGILYFKTNPWNNSSGLGVYSPTTRMTINELGNVGINTTSPNHRFDVSGNINFSGVLKFGGNDVIYGTSTDIYMNARVITNNTSLANDGMYLNYNSGGTTGAHLRFYANAANERMRIDASTGYVGIGTTSPAAQLHIAAASDIRGLRVSNTATNSYAEIQLAADSREFRLGVGGSATGAGVASEFYIWDNNAAAIRLALDANGNLGLGTTSPYSATNYRFITTDSSTGSGIQFRANGTAYGEAYATSGGFILNAIGNIPLQVYANGSERVRVFGNGNVVVNSTTDAGYKFDVNGTTRFGGASTFSSSLTVSGDLIQKSFSTVVITNLGAASTQAQRFEIIRGFYDFNDWSPTGIVEIEVHERQYSRGLMKRYVFSYGYYDSSNLRLVEMSGAGDNNFRVTMGTKTLISGDMYYVPVYLEARYYGSVDVIVRTRRARTTNNLSTVPGDVYINESPSAVSISDFTSDSTVYLNETASVQTIANGRLGIGTAVPDSLLHVAGDQSAQLRVQGTGSNGGNITIDASNGYSMLNFQNTTSTKWTIRNDGSNNRLAFLLNGSSANEVVTVLTSGNVGIGTTAPSSNLQVGSISTSGNRTIRITDSGYGLLLSGGGGGTNNYVQSIGTTIPLYFLAGNNNDANYIFSSTGNVGIGTASPGAKLTVVGEGTGTGLIGSAGFGGNNYTGISLNGGLSTASYNFLSSPTDSTLYINRPNGSTIRFREANGSEQLYIASGGNVGINTSTPSYKLHVVGSNNTTPFGISVGSNATYVFTGNSTSGYTATFNINDTGLYIGHNSNSRSFSLQTNSTDRIAISGTGGVTLSSLAGSGSRMVVADANGLLSTQAIPSGGGGGGGTVTSVALATGTSGTDVNISGSPITSSGTITLNIPDASATARGLVNTGNQTFAGNKTFTGQISINGAPAVTDGGFAMYMLSTYTLSSNVTNTNLYATVDALRINMGSFTMSGGVSYNVCANLNQVSINGSAGGATTQPIRGIISGILGAPGGSSMNISDYRYFEAKSPDAAGIAGHVVTSMFGLRIAQLRGASNFTITNGWGIYQEGSQDNNYFNGSVLIGSATVGSYKLDVTNNFRVNTAAGSPIAIESFVNSAVSGSAVASVYSTASASTIAFGSQANDTYLVGGYVFIGNQSAKFMVNGDNLSGAYDGWGTIGASNKYLSAGFFNNLTVKTQLVYNQVFVRKTASYTLALGDECEVVEMNVATANTVTVPTNATAAFAVGAQITVTQYGAGQTTIAGAVGVTLRSTNNWLKISAQYGSATLVKVATNEWYVIGNLSA